MQQQPPACLIFRHVHFAYMTLFSVHLPHLVTMHWLNTLMRHDHHTFDAAAATM